MERCEKCLNRRMIISENGYITKCGLSSKKAVACILGEKSYFILIRMMDDSTLKAPKTEIDGILEIIEWEE